MGDESIPGDTDKNEIRDETITLELEYDPDEVHAPAWEFLKTVSVDEAAACDDLATLVEEIADIDTALYRLYREKRAQQDRAAEELFGDGMKPLPDRMRKNGN